MLVTTCIDKIKDKNNKTKLYMLKTATGEIINISSEELKYRIFNYEIHVNNLKLTSDNKLISASNNSIGKYDVMTIQSLEITKQLLQCISEMIKGIVHEVKYIDNMGKYVLMLKLHQGSIIARNIENNQLSLVGHPKVSLLGADSLVIAFSNKISRTDLTSSSPILVDFKVKSCILTKDETDRSKFCKALDYLTNKTLDTYERLSYQDKKDNAQERISTDFHYTLYSESYINNKQINTEIYLFACVIVNTILEKVFGVTIDKSRILSNNITNAQQVIDKFDNLDKLADRICSTTMDKVLRMHADKKQDNIDFERLLELK